MEEIISVKDFNFSYGNTSVLKDVNMVINKLDFVAIVGPNGGGKTTLLKAILGFLQPESGSIKVLNKTPGEVRKHLGYVPQYAVMDSTFPIKVKDVVAQGVYTGNTFFTSSKKIMSKIEPALEKLEIGELLNRQFGELSGGQKQRVLIARAMASSPSILLLDEPTASIDSTVEADFYTLLNEMNKDVTILLVSHDISFVSKYINKIACVNRTVAFHNKEEVSSADIIDHAYHGNASIIHHQCGL